MSCLRLYRLVESARIKAQIVNMTLKFEIPFWNIRLIAQRNNNYLMRTLRFVFGTCVTMKSLKNWDGKIKMK